jgi:uncharacterized protein YgiM (DUF1202 family)
MKDIQENGHSQDKQSKIQWFVMLALFFILLALTLNGIGGKTTPKQDISLSPKKTQTDKESINTSSADRVRVIINGLRLRSTSQVGNNVLGSLASGTELVVLEDKNGWFKVRVANGQEGYVSDRPNYVERVNK